MIVGFDKDGALIEFLFNEEFWKKLSAYDRAFIISHEILHILLEHGKRINDENSQKDIANQAMDICVNELLVGNFGFDRDKLEIEKILESELCWFDTIFPNTKKVKRDREAEYYYNILKILESKKHKTTKGTILDGHLTAKELSDILGEAMPYITNDILNDSGVCQILKDQNGLTGALGQLFEAGVSIGNIPSGEWMNVEKTKVKKQRKWETVIPKRDLYKEIYDIVDVETFVRKNKRLEFFGNDDIILPHDCMVETAVMDKDKIDLFMFLDISGSCVSYANTFYKAYQSINKNRFKIRIFSFDTGAHELNPDDFRVRGGGGTSFACIEHKIQQVIREEKLKYPYVFVITDGKGEAAKPKTPKKWHWFLTKNGASYAIPKESFSHKLADFQN